MSLSFCYKANCLLLKGGTGAMMITENERRSEKILNEIEFGSCRSWLEEIGLRSPSRKNCKRALLCFAATAGHESPLAVTLMQFWAVTCWGEREGDSNRVLFIIKLMALFKAKRLLIDQLLKRENRSCLRIFSSALHLKNVLQSETYSTSHVLESTWPFHTGRAVYCL